MKNPFKYGSRVSGGAFFDREKIMRDMMGVLDGGNNVVLYGPRRYGKSSLVGEVMSRIRARGWVCAELNMMDVVSLEDFVTQYARVLYREAAPVVGALRHIAGLFRRVSPKIGIDDEGKPELKFEISSRKAGVAALRDVLELPVKICPAGRTLVVLDEFQEVESLGLGAQFERTMRSVIQNHEIRPIGANKTRHIDVRIIAATNRDLKEEIREKRFREDLYYRLNVIPMQLSPLRERKEDIEDLANYFIHQYAPAGEPYKLSDGALQKLQAHSWPGNIRELENTIQRTLCFTDPGIINASDLQIDEADPHHGKSLRFSDNGIAYPAADNYDEFREKQLDEEREFLKAKIRESNGSVSAAAEKIGMLRTALYNRLGRLGINTKDIR